MILLKKICFFVLLFIYTVAFSLTHIGTTYNMAQSAQFLTEKSFVIGRWDGTLGIFRSPEKGEWGPVLLQSMNTPSGLGIEMVICPSPLIVITSDRSDSLAIFARASTEELFSLKTIFSYSADLGVANSAISFEVEGKKILVIGHTNGWLSIWKIESSSLKYLRRIDIHSDTPIQSPFSLKNIRGLAHYNGSEIITASEDGDIVMVDIETGEKLFSQRYNPSAQRGINSLSRYNDLIVISNCSVGRADSNLWLYKINKDKFTFLDSANLKENEGVDQVFNFVSIFTTAGSELHVVSSTQEGILWTHKIENDKLIFIDKEKRIDQTAAAFIALNKSSDLLLVVSHDISLYHP